jgi:hypothetical protein
VLVFLTEPSRNQKNPLARQRVFFAERVPLSIGKLAIRRALTSIYA